MNPLLLKIKRVSSSIWPAILWSALTFGLQMIPKKNLPSHNHEFAEDQMIPVPFFDKINHVFFYAVLIFFWLMYLTKKWSIANRAYSIIIFAFIIFGYGVMIEYLQAYTGRDFNNSDVIANIFGILLGVFIFFKLKKIPGEISRD